MKTIQQHKQNATLNKVFRFPEGVMSRRQWLNLQRIKGAIVHETTQRNHAAEEKLSQWLYEHREDRSGNPNWPPTKNWNEKKAQLQAGIFKTNYNLGFPGQSSFYEITKTEFEYLQNMELAEDLATEKHDFQNRIEAGIATQEEIDADMNSEMEMMKKYYC